jgi:hypothetical protein
MLSSTFTKLAYTLPFPINNFDGWKEVIVSDTVHIRIFITTFHLVTNRSHCADFYLINEGPQNVCSMNIYYVNKCSVAKKLGKRWCRWWVWNIGGMISTGESRSTLRKTCPSTALYTTNLTHTHLRSNPGLLAESTTTNCLSHGHGLFTTWMRSVRVGQEEGRV